MTDKMSQKPEVSILCLAYNHKEFIRQALEGFLMQKTDFSFEVLINDDASTDGTVEIIKEYQKKYPKIIKPIFQKENQYSKGLRNLAIRFLAPKAKGKYFALCEGDDYWVDPNKLQMQVDFLNKNKDYAICFHPSKVIYEHIKKKEFIYPNVDKKNWYTKEQLLKLNYIPTSSVIFKKQNYERMPSNIAPADWFLHLYNMQFGKIKYIDKVMSVYRKHDGGIWWDYDLNIKKLWLKNGLYHLAMHNEIFKIYQHNSGHKKIIESNIVKLLTEFYDIDKKEGSDLIKQSIIKYPENFQLLIKDKDMTIQKQEKHIKKLSKAIAEQDKIILHKEGQLEEFRSSKLIQTRNRIINIAKKKDTY